MNSIFTGRNEVVAKVMFLLVSVILSTEGGSASVHAGILPPPGRRETPLAGGPPRRRYPPAKETPPRRRSPCQGDPQKEAPPKRRSLPKGDPPRRRPPHSRPTPKGGIEGDQIQANTQGGSDLGPHPMRKLRGIRSRPTPKGEIEGDQIQALPHPPPPPEKQTPAYGQ